MKEGRRVQQEQPTIIIVIVHGATQTMKVLIRVHKSSSREHHNYQAGDHRRGISFPSNYDPPVSFE